MIGSFLQSLKMFVFLSLITGVAYPLVITAIGQLLFSDLANGSLLSSQNQTIGSSLIGQKFTQNYYFWGRPSATDYNTLPSGGSNLGPTSKKLKDQLKERASKFQSKADGNAPPVPSELLYASGSGLDPHISLETAFYQLDRVAEARGLKSDEGRKKIEALIEKNTCNIFLGIIGHPVVNVLNLNISLDKELEHHDK